MNEIAAVLAALYAAGHTDFDILESLDIMTAGELLARLREFKPAMTPFAIYKRLLRGTLDGRQVRRTWWVNRTQAEAWIASVAEKTTHKQG